MISVIMPTMWKSQLVWPAIRSIVQQPSVGELILIDNSEDDTPNKLFARNFLGKLVYIEEGKNTYVNPAWNKGASLAKYDKLCFANDDVITDWDLLNKMDYEGIISEDRGMIGPNESCWKGLNQSPGVSICDNRPNCYGCLFFMHKNSYLPIPEDLLIHYGDDWLFTKSGKQNYGINAWPMSGESEQTSGLTEFDTVKLVDKHNWFNKYR
jgi:hypothetical protein